MASDHGKPAEPAFTGLPAPELLERLRAGKAALRERRRALPLPEKVRQMLELQRMHFTIVSRRRSMRSWEHPWDVEPQGFHASFRRFAPGI
jgi:hypothetical protein